MKKSMLALAALTAFAGAASAQSSVTIWGIVDASVSKGTGSISDLTSVRNSSYNSSRLGFRGVEDMGGGLKAGFWLEAALANDDGNASGFNFQRRSTVSVGGGWGELRLGRDYTPHFWNHTIYDPFGTNGVGTSQLLNSSLGGATTVRASNSVAYLYGMAFNGNSFGPGKGLHAFVQTYRGEAAAGADTGNGVSFRLGYDAGPLSLAVASGKTQGALNADVTSTNAGGSYNMGVAKLSALWTSDKVAGGKKGSGMLVGANVPMGTNEIRVAFSRYETETAAGVTDGKASKTSLGYVANLSKRTALYATYARVSNTGISAQALNGASTAAGTSSTGMDFGVRHSF
jgi:predicted porin